MDDYKKVVLTSYGYERDYSYILGKRKVQKNTKKILNKKARKSLKNKDTKEFNEYTEE